MRAAAFIAAVSGLGLAAGCASVPRQSGFAEVRRAVEEETGQPVEWNARAPIEPPDDAAVAALLQEEMTADQAVRVAFAHNRDVQATLEELGIARATLIAASTVRNPLLEGEIRFPGGPANPFELVLSQTVMDIFRLGTRKRLGRAQFEAARFRVTAAILNFAGQVRASYYDLLAARRALARQQTILQAQEAWAELARRQHQAGNISDLDLEKEQSLYEHAKLEHARAQLDELQARERLIADLGLAHRAELKLPGDFPPPAAAEPTLAEVEQQVMTRRLDLQVAREQVEAARRGVPLAATSAFEDLAIGVHHEREPDGQRTTGPAATVPLPIFDRGAAERAHARAVFRQSQQRLAALTVTARSEARAAHERLLEARARMGYLRDVVIPRRERIVRLTQLEYNAMLRGVFQLIQARQDLAQAQREEILATRDYWLARTDLDTALLGVGRFSVREEAPEPRRLELSRPTPREGEGQDKDKE